MKDFEKTFKALADRTRLRIISILMAQEACLCDMQAILGLSQPFLSRHLAYLRSAGLIRDRRVGTRIYCSLVLDGDVGRALLKFLQTIMPHFEPFHEDAARMKAYMEQSRQMARAVAEPARSEPQDSAKEIDNGDQNSIVQL